MTKTMKKVINNEFGIEINAQYIADKFSKEMFEANEELVNEVIETSEFRELTKEEDGVKSSLVILSAKGEEVMAWFKGGNWEEYTKVTEAVGHDFETSLDSILEYMNS